MQTNVSKNLGDTVYIKSNVQDNTEFGVYKIVGEVSAEDITPTMNFQEIATGLYAQEVVLPNEKCIVVVKANKTSVILRVGNPEPLVVYCCEKTGEDVEYRRTSNDGTGIESGIYHYCSYGIYSKIPSDYNCSVVFADTQSTSFNYPYEAECPNMQGSVILNNNEYQEISIPVKNKKVKEYLLDWVATETGRPAEDSVKYVKTLMANDTSKGKWVSYVPGVTSANGSKNFNLITSECDAQEITAFIIKMKDYQQFYDGSLVFNWNSGDGE